MQDLPPEEREYVVESTGAKCPLISAKNLLFYYCAKLPSDRQGRKQTAVPPGNLSSALFGCLKLVLVWPWPMRLPAARESPSKELPVAVSSVGPSVPQSVRMYTHGNAPSRAQIHVAAPPVQHLEGGRRRLRHAGGAAQQRARPLSDGWRHVVQAPGQGLGSARNVPPAPPGGLPPASVHGFAQPLRTWHTVSFVLLVWHGSVPVWGACRA
jgi:hypothetical protein